MAIRCEVNKNDIRKVKAAANKIYNEIYSSVTSDSHGLMRELANDYVREVRETIVYQKYAAYWGAYSKRYGNWKMKKIGHRKFWIFTGSVLANLQSWRIARGASSAVAAGLQKNNSDTYSGYGTKKFKMTKGTWYARLIEYGYSILTSGYTVPSRSAFEVTWWKTATTPITKWRDFLFDLGPRLWRK